MTITINGTTGIAGVDGSASTPAMQGSDTNTGVFFPAADTVAITTGGSERVRVDSSGNVGIGVTPSAWTYKALQINQTGYAANGDSAFLTGNAYYDGAWKYITTDIAARFGVNIGTGGFTWSIASSGTAGNAISFTQAMTLDSSGNLLVGQTTNSDKFCLTYNNATQWGLRVTSNASTGYAAVFYTTSGQSGYIYTSGTTTTYTTSSDYRLKENIAPMTGALEKIAALKPCTYTWKLDGSNGQGFIAHELQAVVPDAVVGEKDVVDAEGNPVYQGIDTSFLVATLTAAIQELKALADTQASTITTLTDRITALESKA